MTNTISPEESPKPETKVHPNKEGWTQVIQGGKKKSPFKSQILKPTQKKKTKRQLLLLLVLLLQKRSRHHQQQQQQQCKKRKKHNRKNGHI